MAFADTTIVALRESLEAFLIISIFAGLVLKLGHRNARKHLLWGAGAALALSVALGAVILWGLGESEIPQEELFEGIAATVAVGILTYMIIWMYRNTMQMVGGFHQRAKLALDAGRPAVLFGIAFVAVFREGLETVLFFATQSGDMSAGELILSALVGILVSAIVAFLVFTGIVRLNLKKFFAVTGILLIFFAAGLLMQAAHEFTETGYLPETDHVWDTSGVLDQTSDAGSLVKAVFGYRHSPTLLEAIAYFGYVVGMIAWYMRGVLKMGRPTAVSSPKASS